MVMSRDMANRMRLLQHVPRLPIVPVIRRQTVAEHVFGVMAICEFMRGYVSHQVDIDLVMRYALLHDSTEAIISDIPAPVKHENPGIKEAERRYSGELLMTEMDLKKAEFALFKLFDLTEFIHYLQSEQRFGNGHVSELLVRQFPFEKDKFEHVPEWAISFTSYQDYRNEMELAFNTFKLPIFDAVGRYDE